MILARSILAQHGVYSDDDSPGRSVHSFLIKALESLDKLDKGNRLVYKCAKFIRQLSERHSGQGESCRQHDSFPYHLFVPMKADANEIVSLPAPHPEEDGTGPLGHPLSQNSTSQQTFPALVEDPQMVQFSTHDLFNPYFEEFVMNEQPPEFWP